jgi:hypothetical protein
MAKLGSRWGKKAPVQDSAPEKKQIRVYVATPAYDGKVHTDFAVSLAESCMYAASMGIHVTASVMGNGAFIDLARNNFAHMFLQTDCTHLFFIDSDLRWEPRAFLGLATSGRPVCAGIYRKRQEPEEYPVRFLEDKEGAIEIADGGWIKCDRVATGFLCIERRVIEEMTKDAEIYSQGGGGICDKVAKLFYTKLVAGDDGVSRFMGEDYAWCDDYVTRYNEPIWVWPDFDFDHDGYKGNWHKYLNRLAEEWEAKNVESN